MCSLKNKEERSKNMDLKQKLYRSDTDKMICGVCGGLGEYFQVDPTIIRLIWAIFVCTGPGILAYIVAAFIIPRRL